MFRPMRRFKQQINDSECKEILKNEKRGVLSLLGDDGYPYGLPMSLLYSEEDNKIYFHCAKEGHKIDAIKNYDKASFCVYDSGFREELIHATASHGWSITVDIKPEHEMEKVLYAVDELTGLVGAVVIMRPSKSVQDLEVKSVKKKYKSANFAAGCSREVIERGAELLGWTLEDLIDRTIKALRTFRP